MVRQITQDLYYVGCSDRRLELFENIYPISRGVSYNSYLVLDEKTVLLDTVDESVSREFLENVQETLNGRNLDYFVVHHMEPDHCAVLLEIVKAYPEVKIVCNTKIVAMMKQFFDFDPKDQAVLVKEGDTLNTGRHTFTFVMAPMVHWPEVMVSYDQTDKILYSADAFGTFGALDGNLFADQVAFEQEWLGDARRYYTNIVGKYGVQVQSLLKKAAGLEIAMICPLHGPIWRENLNWFIGKYQTWSSYQAEEKAVMIAYGSVYGNTAKAAQYLAGCLAKKGVNRIKVYDTSKTDLSELVAEAFRCSHLVFAAATYNGGIFTKTEQMLLDLKAHNLQNRTIGLIENGSWAPMAAKQMKAILEPLKNMTFLEQTVSIKSAMTEENKKELEKMADEIAVVILS